MTANTLEGDHLTSVPVLTLRHNWRHGVGLRLCRVEFFRARQDNVEPPSSSPAPVYKAGDLRHAADCPVSLTMNESCGKLTVILSGVTDSDEGRCVGRQFKP